MLFNECTFPFHQIPHSSPTSQPHSPITPSAIPSTLTFTSIPSTPTIPTLTVACSPTYQHVSQHAPQSNPTPLPIPQLDPLPSDHSSSDLFPQPLNIHPMQTRSKSSISKLKAPIATTHPLPSHLSSDYIPTTYIQASKHQHWRHAMQEEFNALLNTSTWSLVPQNSS